MHVATKPLWKLMGVQNLHFCEHICPACKKVDEAQKREAHFKMLDGLTIEERLRRVEEWIYDYNPPVDPRKTTF